MSETLLPTPLPSSFVKITANFTLAVGLRYLAHYMRAPRGFLAT